jgi:hypothetical protein
MKHLVLVIAVVAFSTSASAEDAYQDFFELRLVRDIYVFLEDGVSDGCLSNPNALKVEAELVLRRSGIVLSNPTETEHHGLEIRPLGYELGTGACVVRLDVSLRRTSRAPEGHPVIIDAYKNGELLSSDTKPGMQEGLRAAVSEIVSDLANEILKARGN